MQRFVQHRWLLYWIFTVVHKSVNRDHCCDQLTRIHHTPSVSEPRRVVCSDMTSDIQFTCIVLACKQLVICTCMADCTCVIPWMDNSQHVDVYSTPAPFCKSASTAWHEPAAQAHRWQCLQSIESNRNNCSTIHLQRNKATSEMDNTGVNQHCVKRLYLQTNQAAWLQREQYHSDSNK